MTDFKVCNPYRTKVIEPSPGQFFSGHACKLYPMATSESRHIFIALILEIVMPIITTHSRSNSVATCID